LVECVADFVRIKIREEIASAMFFAIQADDTTDILEKCALSIRFVNKLSQIKERFLGFFDVSEDRTADALYTIITNVLGPYEFKKIKLVAQCYDGASVTPGSLK
jgi:hypothetical protein